MFFYVFLTVSIFFITNSLSFDFK